MKRLVLAALFAVAPIAAVPIAAAAHEFVAGDLTIGHPYSYATAQSAAVAAGFLDVTNAGDEADRLIGASTPAAGRVEIHTMTMENDVMKMRKIEGLDVPAQGTLDLAPKGNHLMLLDVKRAFRQGDMIPLTLEFEKAGKVDVELKVEAPGTIPARHEVKDGEPMDDHKGHNMRSGDGKPAASPKMIMLGSDMAEPKAAPAAKTDEAAPVEDHSAHTGH